MFGMRFVTAAVLAAPLGTAVAQIPQPFEGVVEYNMTMGVRTVHTTYYQKGTRVRTEMDMGGQEGMGGMGGMAMIIDGATGTMTSIVPSQKIYMTMNLREMAAGIHQQGRDTTPLPKITSTGRHETIAGHDCEHVIMTSGRDHSQVDMCVARGMGYYMSGGGSGPGAAQSFWSNIPNANDPRYAEFRRQFANGFFPLRMETKNDQGQVEMTMVATKVDRRSLSDDLFHPPADFREMKMPGR
jgi:uncharacterized protein DUF4412